MKHRRPSFYRIQDKRFLRLYSARRRMLIANNAPPEYLAKLDSKLAQVTARKLLGQTNKNALE